MRKLFWLALVLPLVAGPPLTRAERTNFTETSTYRDVMEFLWTLRRSSAKLRIKFLATSREGRKIPLAIVSEEGVGSPREARALGKEVVYIEANIHAGEVEGKEASLMMIRELLQGKYPDLLKNQVILFCPIFNPDGNEKLGRNRHEDGGPPLVGVRYNGQGLDLNRDFVKQESPEVRGLVRVLEEWDPILFVDMHTTDGVYHRHVVTWQPQMAPWTDPALTSYSWEKMFPEINQLMKGLGYRPIPYGNFLDRKSPERGWIFRAVGARYSTNYVGLRNRFAILDENYARADFRTRVMGAHAFLRAILSFTSRHGREMREIEREADRRAMERVAGSDFGVEFRLKKILDFDLSSFRFKLEKIPPEKREKYPSWFGGLLVKKTDIPATYHLYLYAPVEPTASVKLPGGYIILPAGTHTVEILRRNGIRVEKILRPLRTEAEVFNIQEIKASPLPYQGHHLKKVRGFYQRKEVKIPEGSFLVPMNQPLSRLAAVMLEPKSPDGFLTWGLFDATLVSEWGGKPWMVPVYRVERMPRVEAVLLR